MSGDGSGVSIYPDRSHRKRRGTLAYQYWGECDGGGGELEGMNGLDGGMTTQGAGGGGDLCPKFTYDSLVYLYDNGVLLAIFDKDDEVVDMFVNGPQGLIATYPQNDDALLKYHINDHLGSPRVIMSGAAGQQAQVVQYYDYGPYGELIDSWGSYESELKFTGKELDDESSFDLYYFGARYYDSRIGMFTSIDKASQFASGYVYGGNNPTMGVDPDGNIFWVPVILGAVAGTYSGAQIAQAQDYDGAKFLGAVLGGAAIGGLSGLLGGAIAGSVSNPVLGGIYGGAMGGGVNGYGLGVLGGLKPRDALKIGSKTAIAGAVGGLTSQAFSGPYGAAAGGFAAGAAGYGLSMGDAARLDEGLLAASIGAAVSYATYKVDASLRHSRKLHDSNLDNSEARDAIQFHGRRSFERNREEGIWFLDGGGRQTRIGGLTGVDMSPFPSNAKAMVHFHHTVDGPVPGQPGFSFVPDHSTADIAVSNGMLTQLLQPMNSWVINPQNVYVYNPMVHSTPLVGPAPMLVGPTNNYFMMKYYALGFYGY